MVKRITLFVLQFVAFLGLLFLGGNWDAVNLQHELRQMQQGIKPSPLLTTTKFPVGSHILIAEGIIFATILLLLILLFQALRKRLNPWAGISFLAYILAVIIAFALKIGLPPAS